MANMWIILSALSAIAVLVAGQEITSPRVTIAQGTVVGTVAVNESYIQFYGIPYADSTAGSNRFKAPSAPPNFDSEFIANRKGVKCVRALGAGYEGTEDCLVVDIFTSSLDFNRGLPVMVWLQGQELDNDNNPEISFRKFVEKDVIIVNLNYRESVLGFLCLGTEDAPGNAGLKDVIAGLKWIQQNIASFGGDPNNISLFGHGSGASIVDLITLTPAAEGLIHKAIAQSGTALAPWAVTRNNLKYAVQVAEALGHEVPDVESLSNVLSRTSVAALMAVINELDLTDNSLAFAPCIERTIENVEAVLLTSPYQTLMEGNQLQIPFMTGFVDNEGTLRAEQAINGDWMTRMDESFEDFLQPDLDFANENQEREIAEAVKTFYFRQNAINLNSVTDFLRYNGDTMILISAIREARMRVASSNSPVYLYQFSYRGALSENLQRPLSINTAGHKEELLYMFYEENDVEVSTFDLTISDILIERWINFATNGVPTSETSQTNWQPYTSSNTNFLRVLDDEEIIAIGNSNFDVQFQNPHPEILAFWEPIYTSYFMDAESKWSLTDRNDETDENTEGETDPEGDNTNPEEENGDNTNPEEEENGDNANPEDGGDEDNGAGDGDGAPDSASTAVGYTFAILTMFALLDKFHNIQILS